FLWGEFADWYVEISKVQLKAGNAAAWTTAAVLFQVLDTSLRLLHPFIPYVTEETWQQLKQAFQPVGIAPAEGWAEALMIADWPRPQTLAYDEVAAAFERIRELVTRIRATRAESNVDAGKKIPAVIVAEIGRASW